ncbi:hypothetical protein N7451_012386 [Penicillium sp. IBT 35674x]|nr:hypothetical protein N7451_012386 [Penicillium sp. IBT 35674x]
MKDRPANEPKQFKNTLGNDAGFMSHTMLYPNDSQAFHADLELASFDHTDQSLIDHSGIAKTAQYGDADRYYPKQLVQMEDIYSIPDGLFGIPQTYFGGSNFHMSPADHPWENPSISTLLDMKVNPPLPYRDSHSETTNEPGDGFPVDRDPTSLPVDEDNTFLAKWRNEGFRFRAVLGAPTAMGRNSEDPTLTYLNKGQAYKLSISDSKASAVGGQAKKYRAHVQVAFDQEQSRSNTATCWKLWREARVMSKRSPEEKIPFAVEFAGPASSDCEFQVEQEFFDGFCITWKLNHATGLNICDFSLRLHFLSTDFTLSKGVKGMPVRLCAQIQELTSPVNNRKPDDPEICYCKIQLFRDHGAERKMSIDNGNLTKAIEKLKQKMSSVTPNSVTRKRKRGDHSESTHQVLETIRAPKLEMQQKPSNDAMDSKLIELERMALSKQPRTILALRGSKGDDPSLYPVHMADHQKSELHSEISSANTISTNSEDAGSGGSKPIDADIFDGGSAGFRRIRVYQKQRRGSTSSAVTVQPPPLVACFYIRLMLESSQQFYRAVYLSDRTTRDLALAISAKFGITLTDDFNILHVGDKDLKILVDDEYVQQIPEGQHMGIQLDANAASEGKARVYAMQLLY